MTRRIFAVSLSILVIMSAMFASLAVAQNDEELPPHGHILVLGLEFGDEGEISYRKCVDLANNRALPLHAHHENVHFGQAGQALFNAGHVVGPTAPFPGALFEDCAGLEAIIAPGTQ